MLDMSLLKQITMENINSDTCGDCDKDTMGYYISLPKDIQKVYEKYLLNSDNTVSDRICIESVWCEYWIDENTFHWILHFEDSNIDVSEDFKCEYIENLVLERYKKEYL